MQFKFDSDAYYANFRELKERYGPTIEPFPGMDLQFRERNKSYMEKRSSSSRVRDDELGQLKFLNYTVLMQKFNFMRGKQLMQHTCDLEQLVDSNLWQITVQSDESMQKS